ncbi:MAG TPA: DM13 domain-containing protein [Nitrososphaera sp.]|nr:DM13 domain-containing protein [Nitrososphaera sp.]
MKKSMIVPIIVAAVAVPAGVYAASPLFTNTTINEPLPAADDKMVEDNTIDAVMADKNDDAMMEKDDIMMADESEDAITEMELSGNFAGAGDGLHNAEGLAKVISLEDGSDVLRLEDLKVTNGPDLYVYLATDMQASDFVDLGWLKANNGNQNYDIPEGTDLSKYNTVVIWCKAFSVFFGGAELTSNMST